MRRQNTIVAAFLGFVLAAANAYAHVTVTPRESQAGAEQTYTVRVHTEGTVSSASLELEIPEGVHVTQVIPGKGFTFEVRKEKDRIVAITWKREIKPKGFAAFTFAAHNPSFGSLVWKAHQTFADGSMRHWVGERGSKEAASMTTIVGKGETTKTPAADPAHKH